MKILIVDDEHIIRSGMRTIIQRSGEDWIVSGEAVDGIDAIDQLDRELPDLVITDIRMPEMDGIELTKYIKTKFKEVLVIIISGYAEFNFAQEAIRYGALDYILKPTKPENLVSVLRKAQKLIDERDLKKAEEEKLNREIAVLKSKLNGKSANCGADQHDCREKSQQYRKIIAHAVEYMYSNYNQELTLKHMAGLLHINPSYFCDLFRQETGESFSEYLIRIRVEKAKELLQSRVELRSYEIAELVGYRDAKYFSQVFKKLVGVTPTEFREGELN